jgi:hypothetical protein
LLRWCSPIVHSELDEHQVRPMDKYIVPEPENAKV